MKLIISTLCCIIGFSMLIAASFPIYEEVSFLRKAHTAPGKVIELVRIPGSASKRTSAVYTPVIQYTPENGQPITFRTKISNTPPAFEIGEAVTVFYLPNNPQDAQVKSLTEQWMVAGLLGLPGVVLSILGSRFFVLIYLRNRQKK